MAYATGDKILDDEYNTFVNSSTSPYGYNHFAGTGATVYGLGQTAISTVDAANDNTITATQWNTLFTGMDNIANHTNDSLTYCGYFGIRSRFSIISGRSSRWFYISNCFNYFISIRSGKCGKCLVTITHS